MLNKIIADVEKREQENPIQDNRSNNYSVSSLMSNEITYKNALNNLDTIDEKQLYEIVKVSYNNILKNLLNSTNRDLNIITHPKLIKCLTHVFNTVTLTHDEKVYCNTITYDYITSSYNDKYIKELLMMMARIVNKEEISKLQALSLPDDVVVYLALAKNSSFDEDVNIKRLNFVICQAPEAIMTVQTIIYIYERLCTSLGKLFISTMFDVYNDDEEWVTSNIMEVYSNCSLACLHILNNSTTITIKTVLLNYVETFKVVYGGDISKVRFALRTCSRDFSRLLTIVEELEYENARVP